MSRKRARSTSSILSQAALYGFIGIMILFAVGVLIAGGITGYMVGTSLWGLAGGILGVVIGPIVFFVVVQIAGLGEKLDD